MFKNSKLFLIPLTLYIFCVSCSKGFLDAKPDLNMITPNTLHDMQGLLDNAGTLNNSSRSNLEISNGDFFVPDNILISADDYLQMLYTWEDNADLFKPEWTRSYSIIFIANSVLEAAENYQPKNTNEQEIRNAIKGAACFFRGSDFWNLLQSYAPVYDESSNQQLGIILSLDNNVLRRSPRADLETSYQQVLNDLKLAALHLPVVTKHKTRPNKVAAYGMLARVYLSMENYELAYQYADSALKLYSTLIDYNTLSKPNVATNPFQRYNDEVIFHSVLLSNSLISVSTTSGFVDTLLMKSYSENDLRKTMFFREYNGFFRMTGRYSGLGTGFGGIATDELFLIRSECNARNGNISQAMDDLNTLLETRWVTSTFEPFNATNEHEALTIILMERRKQLLLRGLRWTDLRRLNKDPRFAVTLSRTALGNNYVLPPNDPGYTFLIPNREILDNSLVEQNPQ